ncbi:ATP-binding cassette, subfamily B [Eubacterium ruminantium]|uniref:ATP-binding cassette, subfamily B n=1 Tax=Eubacterium ruminantium TaxID=42322 RepID=A0A1T4MCP4_9FIRM|nr:MULTISPECIES: ABC transporter ATP-binding protein [Eubacterium]MCR5368558.1 ABC transporter ATP-binding protein/permease [Eubacterium sp.]SCW46983.1 ATP-binding cassette, subfamily B [Eubacterium ruminantium]SDM53898.1 ATP-binding cassette, subfamily B [Eubacterium ruminantium]SJZ64514.1 ATP-binding cassette, subfamily B [Eubacterium ruminantium]
MNKKTIGRVVKYLKPYIPLIIISLMAAAATTLLSLYVPILAGKAIDLIIAPGIVDLDGISKILIRMIMVILLAALFQWIMNVINNHITYRVVKDIRKKAFDHIQSLPLSYLDTKQYGDFVSRIIADIDQFSDGLLMGFSQFFTGLVMIIGTLCFMFTLNITITLVVVLLTPLSLFVAAFIAKKTYNLFVKQSEKRALLTGMVEEMVGNEKVVQAFSYEDDAIERFDKINDELADVSLKATFFSSLINPSTRFINNLVYAAVGIVGAVFVLKGRITVGQLTCFLSYANQYTKPFNEISGVVTELQNALACAGRVFELIDEEPETPDKENAVVLKDVKGSVMLKDVNFSYVPDKKLIQNLNLLVKPGMRVAIVGPTGCGKSTVINLLMRFYDVNSGSIQVEGNDVRDITRKSLRDNYGMVLQETWLKAASIKENIAYGREATDEEIIAAAKATHAHSFIKRLPNGYDTVLGEDGGSLSQGQKQLLCITRVMLSVPPMLILDEATSSIDTRTELRVQRAFAKLMAGRTSFIVAHRLSTIMEADMILVMKDGNIIEQGNHESLMKLGGFYSDLFNSQYKNV